LASPVRRHCLNEVGEKRSVVLLARRPHREHTLDKPAPALALRTVPALAPQYRRSQRLLGRVVRRLNFLSMDKRPQRFPVFQKLRTQRAQRVGLVSVSFQALAYRRLERFELLLHRRLRQLTLAILGPYHQHVLSQCQQCHRFFLPRPCSLGPAP
jgi:hypothetical protein